MYLFCWGKFIIWNARVDVCTVINLQEVKRHVILNCNCTQENEQIVCCPLYYKLPEDYLAVHKVQVTEKKHKYTGPIMRNYHKNKHYKRDGISFHMGF